jgi:eukaryotic-like serine/threonine-protein kinase
VDQAPTHPNTELADRYALTEMVGAGAMSTVWRAFDRRLGRYVAVKVLAMSDDLTSWHRFQREARHVASLSHPNIVPVFDFGTDGDLSYIVMEYVDGPSLRQLLHARAVLSIAQVAELAVGVLAGMGHAHQRGVVHRDVKPGNVLLSTSDVSNLVKVADFGVARGFGDTTELTTQGAFVGTATYASPEQFAGGAIGPASDLYSLGCMLYRCLVGRPPFEAPDVEHLMLQHRFAEPESIRAVRPEVPEEIESAIIRSLQKDPARRFDSAEEMAGPFVGYVSNELRETVLPLRRQPVTDPSSTTADGGNSASSTNRAVTIASGTTSPLADSDNPHKATDHRRTAGTHRVVIALTVAVVVTALAVTWGVLRRHPATLPSRARTVLASGGTLQPGQSIVSPNGQYILSMQPDGNLVEYPRHGSRPSWQSGSSGNFGAYAVVQVDGDFVVYPHGESAPPPGHPTPALWSTGTYGHPGTSVEILNDGATVVRLPHRGATIWTSTGA